MGASLPQLVLPIKRERSSERLTSVGGLVVLEEIAHAMKLWAGAGGACGARSAQRPLDPGVAQPDLVLRGQLLAKMPHV